MVVSLSMTANLRTYWLALPALALALICALQLAPAHAQSEKPEVVYQNIEAGDTINEPAAVIQLCFKNPINIKDQFAGGDFSFEVTRPDGIGLGHRDVFQIDGYGVLVLPGNIAGETAGEWTFAYRVTSPDGTQALEDEFTYTVDPDGDPAPKETPPACVGEGGTATTLPSGVTAAPGTFSPSTPTPVPPDASGGPTGSPLPSSGTPRTASPAANDANNDGRDDDDPSVLTLALLTIGTAGGIGLILLVGFLVRRRVGFQPHAPHGDDTGDHH